MKELILLFSVPAFVVIVMHELEILGHRIYPLIVRILPFKPFTCELCLSFWVYLGIKSGLDGFHLVNVLESFLSGFIGYEISKRFIKF